MNLQIVEIDRVQAGRYGAEIQEDWGQRCFVIMCDSEPTVCLLAWKNSFHNRNVYVQPYFLKKQMDWQAAFSFVKNYFAAPLQCMLPCDDERVPMLRRGGFVLVRRCFEREFGKTDWKDVDPITPKLVAYASSSREYDNACKLLYDTYVRNHAKINPLSVDYQTFAADLPHTVYCAEEGAQCGFAFVEENEICYMGGSGNLKNFFAGMLKIIFSTYQTVLFEADDIDDAAMQLKNLFDDPCDDSFDTYIGE